MQFEGFDVQTLEERSGVSKHTFIPQATETDVCLICHHAASSIPAEPLVHTSGLHCSCCYFVHVSCQAVYRKLQTRNCLFCTDTKPELVRRNGWAREYPPKSFWEDEPMMFAAMMVITILIFSFLAPYLGLQNQFNNAV